MQIGEHYFTITTTNGSLNLVSSPQNISITYSPLFMGYILSINVGYLTYFWRRKKEDNMNFTVRTISVVVPTNELFSYPYIQKELKKPTQGIPEKVYTKEGYIELLINDDDNLKLDLVRINENRIADKLGVQEYPDKLSTSQIVYDRVCSSEDLNSIRNVYMNRLNLAEPPYITEENLSRYYIESR